MGALALALQALTTVCAGERGASGRPSPGHVRGLACSVSAAELDAALRLLHVLLEPNMRGNLRMTAQRRG